MLDKYLLKEERKEEQKEGNETLRAFIRIKICQNEIDVPLNKGK